MINVAMSKCSLFIAQRDVLHVSHTPCVTICCYHGRSGSVWICGLDFLCDTSSVAFGVLPLTSTQRDNEALYSGAKDAHRDYRPSSQPTENMWEHRAIMVLFWKAHDEKKTFLVLGFVQSVSISILTTFGAIPSCRRHKHLTYQLFPVFNVVHN